MNIAFAGFRDSHILGLYNTALVIAPVYLEDIDCVKATHKGVSVERKGKHINVKIDVEAKIVIGDSDFKALPGEYRFDM